MSGRNEEPPRAATPLSSRTVVSSADEADVIVVGFGVAGASAAIEAAVHGADVLLLERTFAWGGAASLGGGSIYMGGGTPLQKACGFDDSPEDMQSFLTAAMGPGADAAKLAVFAERSVEHFNWLASCGVPFRAAFYDEPAWEPAGDEGLMYTGGENAYPFADLVRPAPRGHVPQMRGKRTGTRGGGYMLMATLAETVGSLGVRVDYDTRFERLVTESDGRVSGVVVSSYGEELVLHARRSVVLAGGGFASNSEMVARHVPALIGRSGSAVQADDGQCIRAAQALGADVAHMGACHVAIHTDAALMARGIVVDGRGDRVINEDTYPGRIGHELVVHRGSQGFVLADKQAIEEAAVDPSDSSMPPQPRTSWVSDDVAELEVSAGIPAGALAATLEVYNRHAAMGVDPVHHKASRWVRPLRAPYGLFDLRGETSGFTLGGLRTDVDGAVLDVDGEPIPGLRAAGRPTLGVAAGGYASGCSLGDGSFFGRRAGRAAAYDFAAAHCR